jgi:hypothetical protein
LHKKWELAIALTFAEAVVSVQLSQYSAYLKGEGWLMKAIAFALTTFP